MWGKYLLISITAAVAAGGELDFPPGFKLGCASASYQVEGAWNHADKGESIWDRLTHTRPELVAEAATGDVACDSFHQWQTDVDLLTELGVHFYRFSISWPRLLPTGLPNNVSETGKQYYNNLINGLLDRGIEPVVTLYHWDLPQSLQELGGWANPLIKDWFGDYARIVFDLYGDRVKTWVTINEPLVHCDLGYTGGKMAPLVKESWVAPHLCARHVLLAHATAYRIYDKEFRAKFNGQISIGNHVIWYEPATDSIKDREATELAMAVQVGRYTEPIFGKGGWPASVEKLVAENSKRQGYPRSRLPSFTQEEKDFIKGTFDFFALNHYTSRLVRSSTQMTDSPGWGGFPMTEWEELPAKFEAHPDWPVACNGWLKVYPDGFRKLLVWIKKQFGDVPIFITENGYPLLEMGFDDDARVNYYRQYLQALLKAVKEDGVNVIGYTAWTLLDNFEWIDGYRVKFGLYEVDFTDPARPRKARKSARYYASIIKHHSLDVPKEYYKDEL